MTVDTALNLITRWSFIFISLLLLVEYVRFRDRTRRDTLLMFASFAVAILAGELARLTGREGGWPSTAAAIAIMAQPYLLLRLVEHFRSVNVWITRAALAGFALSALLLARSPQPLPKTTTILIVIYFAAVEAYAGGALLAAARRSTGIAHRRLVMVGQGSALLAAVILLAGVQAAVPGGRAAIQPLSRILALLAVLWYYLGFTPPAWLRRNWQLAELHRFLERIGGRSARERAALITTDLCRTATQTVGGLGSTLALRRDGGPALRIHASDIATAPIGAPLDGDGTVSRAMETVHPTALLRTADLAPPLDDLGTAVGAEVACAVPVASAETSWGVLIAFQRRPSLFPEDDAGVLRLIGEQTALLLDLGKLLTEQEQLVRDLQESTRQLETANKELEAFSYSISHDLRAPLRAIDGFTRLLTEEALPSPPPEAARYLAIVRANTRQMGELIDDLLTFSRLSRQPVQRRRVDPGEVVAGALAALHHERDGRSAEIAVDPLPPCSADPALLKQVYVNLLSNALKFTRQVEPARVRVGSRQQDGATVYFVQDNGVGFDMRYAGKLFGVFQRLHRAEEYEGTGVGLAIVQRVVHRHGGRAWADAAPGKGATFYFTLGEETAHPAEGGPDGPQR